MKRYLILALVWLMCCGMSSADKIDFVYRHQMWQCKKTCESRILSNDCFIIKDIGERNKCEDEYREIQIKACDASCK